MPYTFMVDYVSGVDTAGGDSWGAPVFTNTDGVANGTTTFTSATGGFTGKENRFIWIQTKNVRRRIVTVNSNTSVILDATVVAGSGLTFSLGGAVKNSSIFATGYPAAGDTIKYAKSNDKVSVGSCTFTKNSYDVTVPADSFKFTTCSRLKWPVSSNITAGVYTSAYKIGTASTSMAVGSSFTTGLAMYQRVYTQFSGGTATSNDVYSGLSAAAAVDECDTLGGWMCNNTTPAWWKYDFGAGVTKTITEYCFGGDPLATANYKPYTWKFQGSNNDVDWTDLDTRTAVTPVSDQLNFYAIASPAAYRYYRMYITDNVGVGTNYAGFKVIGYVDANTGDFSAFQQLSFWVYQSGGTNYTSQWISIKLCSDTAGATPVDTFTIPAVTFTQWVACTIDKGSALGSNIQSIAIYVDSDPGTPTFYFSNIMACKAEASGAISVNHLIGTGGEGDPWFCIRFMDKTTVRMDEVASTAAVAVPKVKYHGTTTTTTGYTRLPILMNPPLGAGVNYINATFAGSAGNLITYSGGWNTSSGLQDGQTYVSNRSMYGSSYGLYPQAVYLSFERLNPIRFAYGVYASAATPLSVSFDTIAGNSANIVLSTTHNSTISGNALTCSNADALQVSQSSNATVTIGNIVGQMSTGNYGGINLTTYVSGCNIKITGGVYFCNNSLWMSGAGLNRIEITNSEYTAAYHIMINGICRENEIIFTNGFGVGTASMDTYISASVRNNFHVPSSSATTSTNRCVYYVSYSGGDTWHGLTSSGKTYTVVLPAYLWDDIYFRDLTCSGDTNTGGIVPAATRQAADYRGSSFGVRITGLNGSPTTCKTFLPNGIIDTETSVRHTASGMAWKLSPDMNVNYQNQYCPLRLKLGEFYLVSGTTYTITAYMRRTNTGLTGRLVCPINRLSGITTEISDTMTVAADTWEQLSIEISPSSSGVVEIYAEAYGGTTYSLYVDDVEIAES
jgi:hypothetical protein